MTCYRIETDGKLRIRVDSREQYQVFLTGIFVGADLDTAHKDMIWRVLSSNPAEYSFKLPDGRMVRVAREDEE